jgi:hypothetical protein
MSIKRIFPFFFFFFLFLCKIQAQEVSPYSQFLAGDMRGAGFTAQNSMGRITSAFHGPLHINFSNPAAYSSLKLTTLEGGAVFSSKKIYTQNGTTHAGTGFIDFVALAFPILKRVNQGDLKKEKEYNVAGISVGLVPYSSVKYNFEVPEITADSVNYTRAFNGSGSIYQLYAGAGIKFPMKNDTAKHTFAVGVNAIYLFGRNRYVEFVNFNTNTNYFGTRKNSVLRTSDVAWNAGMQYIVRFPQRWALTLGADAYVPMGVNAKYSDTWDRFQVSSGGIGVLDTVYETSETTISRKFPLQMGGGFLLKKANMWLVSADVHYNIWENFQDIFNPGLTAKNSVRINGGTEFTPLGKGKPNFLKRTHYRFGGWYETAVLNLRSKDIIQYGITFGLGLPAKGSFSLINIGMEIAQRGTTANGLAKETSIRTYIGVTLNDKWFIKRKYD